MLATPHLFILQLIYHPCTSQIFLKHMPPYFSHYHAQVLKNINHYLTQIGFYHIF
jgi:hypothetical protein